MIRANYVQEIDASDIILEARALLAVGMDGTIVVLDVNSDNEYLASDVRSSAQHLCQVMKFWPETEPMDAGLYEFRGFSAPERQPGSGVRVIHRGACTKVAC